ncbi:MAG: hypothetical protein B0W54_01390 [Cellvibrio sp. 79]|nr:MAG: hypothetical protein B0W54_01390 [Cellvibrio sp. 79]
MNMPPKIIEGAEVIEWAWSGEAPFGVVRCESGVAATEIYGLAICRYPQSGKIYRFSCDAEWRVEQDSDCQSVEEAKSNLPLQYKEVEAIWHKWE